MDKKKKLVYFLFIFIIREIRMPTKDQNIPNV